MSSGRQLASSVGPLLISLLSPGAEPPHGRRQLKGSPGILLERACSKRSCELLLQVRWCTSPADQSLSGRAPATQTSHSLFKTPAGEETYTAPRSSKLYLQRRHRATVSQWGILQAGRRPTQQNSALNIIRGIEERAGGGAGSTAPGRTGRLLHAKPAQLPVSQPRFRRR